MKPAVVVALAGIVAAAKDQRTFAVLRFNNKQLTKGRMDPLRYPGRASTHVHNILGGSAFSTTSTGLDLRRSKCSTAKVKGDNSNYWFPSLYFKDPQTGKFEDVEVFYANAYYFFEATNDDIKAFPLGLGLISGDVDTRSPPAGGAGTNLDPSKGPVNPVKWTCPRDGSRSDQPAWPAGSDGTRAGIGDPVNKGEGVGFPDVNCDGFGSPLRADIHFPSCYNPDAGLVDYKHNAVFPSDGGGGKTDCPKGYIHLPHLFLEVYWNTPAFKDRWEQGKMDQPFVLANGDATGFSLHADFMAGWDEKLLQHIIDTCDAGTGGMDKCPDLPLGLNESDCTIESLIDEKIGGLLESLPGDNPVTGWASGGSNSSSPSPRETAQGTSSAYQPDASSQPTGDQGHPAKRVRDASQTGSPVKKPSSNSSQDVAGFKYAGCFKDASERALGGIVRADLGLVSNEKCVSHCKTSGYALAGTEYGGQCYCGNELVGSKHLGEGRCEMPCEADASQMCGGGWALSVYSKDGQAALKGTKSRRHLHHHARRHRGHHS